MSLTIAIPTTKTECNDGGHKLYTSYQITCSSTLGDYPIGETKVYRRFNDFLWLYKRLVDEHQLTKNRKDPVPPPVKPPSKKAMGRFKDKFIEKRRIKLENWIQALSTHPVWPGLKVFRLFITEPNMMGVIRY